MATMCVQSDALNLRSQPEVTEGNIITVLMKCHPVTVMRDAPVSGWVEVETDVDAAQHTGFVSRRLLRDQTTDAKERLMTAAVKEWIRFDRALGKEHVDPYFKFVGEMWRAIGLDLDGKDRDQPWSAAFISWIVKQAGPAYNGFKTAAAHARYIHDSIKKRQAGTAAPFWGFRLHEHRVGLGDLVCQWRVNPMTFDKAAASDSFFSHCDVVVEVSGNAVRAIGGNNSHTVGFKTYATNADGFLKAENKVFALLRNNI